MAAVDQRHLKSTEDSAEPPLGERDNPNTLYVKTIAGETQARAMARCATTPAVQAALTVKQFEAAPLVGVSLDALVKDLSENCKRLNDGDLTQSEALLTGQSHSLDAIFNKLARMASSHLANGGNIEIADTLLLLGLKAQSQCRSTIEALAEIKNPSHVTFAKQANIAHGPQQVNNSVGARMENTEIPPNKLLEHTNEERLESAAKRAAIGADSPLETVAAVNGTKNGRR